MVALLVLRIWLADMLARCLGFRSVLGSIGELLCMCGMSVLEVVQEPSTSDSSDKEICEDMSNK